MAKPNITLDEALKLADAMIVSSEDGTKWIRVDQLRALDAVGASQEEPEPGPKTFAEAKAAAAQDPELRAAFADRPPNLGPSPSAARA